MACTRSPLLLRYPVMSSKENVAPSLSATTAQARSPVFGSGSPMTATSATAGWA